MENSTAASITDFAPMDSSMVKFRNPTSVATPTGYSHAVEIDLGNCRMILISGQIPQDQQGNLVGKQKFKKQRIANPDKEK